MLVNRPIKALLLQIGREPININNDEYYDVLVSRQEAYTKNNDTCESSTLFSSGSSVVVHLEDGGPWMHGMISVGDTEDHRWQSCLNVCD